MFRKVVSLAMAVMAVTLFFGIFSSAQADSGAAAAVNGYFGHHKSTPQLAAYIVTMNGDRLFRVAGRGWVVTGSVSQIDFSTDESGVEHASLSGKALVKGAPADVSIDLTASTIDVSVLNSDDHSERYASHGHLDLEYGYINLAGLR